MRAVIQRVSEASVSIEGTVYSSIRNGILLLLGIEEADNEEDIVWLLNKTAGLRIFSDKEGSMNLDLKAVNGELLIISQFTLHASTRKGKRPSFIKAAKPQMAEELYQEFLRKAKELLPAKVQSGKFGADMKVSLVNDGPVTIIIDTKNKE